MAYKIPGTENDPAIPAGLYYIARQEIDRAAAEGNDPKEVAAAYIAHLLYQRDGLAQEVEASQIDSTSKLLNKKATYGYIEDLIRGLEHPRRASDPFQRALIIELDIENFKAYNDRFGQIEGDKVIEATGGFLWTLPRVERGDIVGRIGGDEFLIVAVYDTRETTDEEVLDSFEERIRDVVFEKYQYLLPLRWNHAFYQPGDTRESLMQRADVKATEDDPARGEKVRYHSHSREQYELALTKSKAATLVNA